MKPRILLDEDIQTNVARALRERGYDAFHVGELGRKGFDDAEQLRFAVEQERCLVSYNARDFVMLHKRYIAANWRHYGIFVSPAQYPTGEILRRIVRLASEHTPESLKNLLLFL